MMMPGVGLGSFGGGKDFGKGGKDFGKDFGISNPNIELEQRVETTQMDFSKLNSNNTTTSEVRVQKELVDTLMTSEARRLLTEESGCNVEWVPNEARVQLSGSPEQVKRAQRLIARVMMHCRWGYSEDKVRRLLKPAAAHAESVLCRLSPMNTLKPGRKTLSAQTPVLSIGKDRSNDVVIRDGLVSRQHCVLSLDEDRGAVYVLDCSTNGTYLNGVRLPKKEVGKVLITHGDELLLKDPSSGEQEYGYIINLTDLSVKTEVKLEAPRRILSADEMSTIAPGRWAQ
jgi:hypothetical protein